ARAAVRLIAVARAGHHAATGGAHCRALKEEVVAYARTGAASLIHGIGAGGSGLAGQTRDVAGPIHAEATGPRIVRARHRRARHRGRGPARAGRRAGRSARGRRPRAAICRILVAHAGDAAVGRTQAGALRVELDARWIVVGARVIDGVRASRMIQAERTRVVLGSIHAQAAEPVVVVAI